MPGNIIALRVLGATELSAPAANAAAIITHDKRLALLCYLLIAQPHGFHRRERVAALLWPEHSDARARHALRQALHELRHNLGAIILTRGMHEIGIARECVWNDAVAFDDALRDHDRERALSLYRGELLDGVVVKGVSAEFQDWLDRQRTRYRDSAARAACELAEQDGAVGNAGAAARWASRAAELAPLDELVLCRLLTVWLQLGQGVTAELLYREFEQRFRQELGLEPSEQIQSLMATIRAPKPAPRSTNFMERGAQASMFRPVDDLDREGHEA